MATLISSGLQGNLQDAHAMRLEHSTEEERAQNAYSKGPEEARRLLCQENEVEATPLIELNAASLAQARLDGFDCECRGSGCHRVQINVSGLMFTTQLKTINRYPETLLGSEELRSPHWDPKREQYFFDRHRPSFEAILYFYQSGGRIRRPVTVPDDIFSEELAFFRMPRSAILEWKMTEGYVPPKPRLLPKNKNQRKMWELFEFPDSSKLARAIAIISIIITLSSVTLSCVETLPPLQTDSCFRPLTYNYSNGSDYDQRPAYTDAKFLVETITSIWFTLEVVVRIICCPNKKIFFKTFMNVMDILAVLPFYILIVTVHVDKCSRESPFDGLRIIRLLRILRIFKLSKHSKGLQVLGMTIRSSLKELFLFLFFAILAVLIFGSCIYVAEYGDDTQFGSIPESLWWGIVTLCTVGYGDMVPVTIQGKIVGCLCAIAGVLTMSLPVPVIVAHFEFFYRQATGRTRG